jgi:CheY-like chemotaxis protein
MPESKKQFSESFSRSLIQIKKELEKLNDDALYLEAVNELYFLYLDILSHAKALEIPPLIRAMSIAVDAMQVLRHRKPPIDPTMVDWLNLFMDFISSWDEQIQSGDFNLISLDSYTLNMIKTTSQATDKSSKTIKRLTVLIVDNHKKFSEQLASFLNKHLKKAFIADTEKKLFSLYEQYKPDFILLDMDATNYDLEAFFKELRKHRIHIPLITISQKELEKSSVHAKCSAHLHKPLQTSLLIQTPL